VQVWINGDSVENVSAIFKAVDEAMVAHKAQQLTSFMLIITSDDPDKFNAAELEKRGLSIPAGSSRESIDVAVVEPDGDAVSSYKINTEAKNTIILYRDKTVTHKMVNLEAKDVDKLKTAIDEMTK
jgi:hypothetical protein